MAKNNKSSNTGTHNYGYFLGEAGNILLWIVLLAYFIVLPLYFKNGYEMIATNKYKCFMTISQYAAIALGTFLVLYFGTWGMNKQEIQAFKPLWKIDLSMLSFILIAFISYLASSFKTVSDKDYGYWFKEGALWGTSGWFMGFMTFLILVAMYFVISRFFIYTQKIWIPILLVTTLIFLWGALNRYQVYPIEMAYQGPSFVSSLGNINWFAGYQSVLAPIVIGFYWAEKRPKVRGVLGAVMIIADMALLLNGSDSAVLGFIIMAYVLFVVSLRDEDEMMRFSETIFLFALSGIIIFILDKMFPEAKDLSATLSDIFVSGASSFIILILCLALRFYFSMCKLGKAKYPDRLKKVLPKYILEITGAVILLLIMCIYVNTVTWGKLPIIGGNSNFIFDSSWGSSRGATWTSGVLNFCGQSFINKLIGTGPDTFYFAMQNAPTAFNYAYSIWENSRLTNAHNEILTLLVNVGILGTAAFICINVFAIKEFIARSKKTPYMIAFALSMIMYLGNNLFSFEQVTNIPFYFLVIGIGASAIVKEDRNGAV